MGSSASSTSGASSKRIQWIDLLRGWAVIVMVETHVVNATLATSLRETDGFHLLRFVNGLVAPSFIFASGLAYAVTTRRKLSSHRSFGPPLFRHLGRLLTILAIGYVLHLPRFDFTYLVNEADADAWAVFFTVDVLQCIAVSLLVLQLLLLATSSHRQLAWVAAGMAGAATLLTPVLWSVDPTSLLPLPLAAYINGNRGSLFPLFPWSGFLFAGVAVGHMYASARELEQAGARPGAEQEAMKRLTVGGAALIVASVVLEPLARMLYPVYDYWSTSPSFFFLRLGIVVLLCSGMFQFERRCGVSPRSVVARMGRESLVVYVAHLLLIFGTFGSFTFADAVGGRFGYGEAAVTTVVLVLLMAVLALGWGWLRQAPPRVRSSLRLSALGILLSVFFFGRWF